MQATRYKPKGKTGSPHRRTVAPRVIEQHSRRCALSAKTGRRCTCSPVYDARVRQGERLHRRTFAALAEAVAWAQTTRDSVRNGAPLPGAPAQAPSLRELSVSFLHRALRGEALTQARRRYAPNSVRIYENALRLRILDHRDGRSGLPLGELPASAVDARAMQDLVDVIAVRDGHVLARHAAAALRAVLRDGYARRLLDSLPPSVSLPPPPPRRDRTITLEEAARLVEFAKADDEAHGRSLFAPLLALLAGTGCRLSEALGLVWGPDGLELDSEPPVARIARETTKSEAGARAVPLDSESVAVLLRHRLATGRPLDGAPVFPDARGAPRSRHGLVPKRIERIAKAAGLPGVTAHVLRHAHATWLAAAAVPPAAAAARLGHSDGTLFLRVYAHPGAAEAATTLAAFSDYKRAQTQPALRKEQ
jgi:integrase